MKSRIFHSLFLILLFCCGNRIKAQEIIIEGTTWASEGAYELYRIVYPPGTTPSSSNYFITLHGGTLITPTATINSSREFVVRWGNTPVVGVISLIDSYANKSGFQEVYVGNFLNPGNAYTFESYFSDVQPKPIVLQNPAEGGFCDGIYQYTWQQSTDNVNWTDISNTVDYPESAPAPDPMKPLYVRRKVECGFWVDYTETVLFRYRSSQIEARNYIRTTEVWKAGVKSLPEVHKLLQGQLKVNTTYYDGLSRPELLVWKAGSPSAKDLVTPYSYDNLGREIKKYLAYEAATGNGLYHTNALAQQVLYMGDPTTGKYKNETNFYAETILENSPVNRPVKSLAPGAAWGGSNVGISTEYTLNSLENEVRIWNIDALNMSAVPVTASNGVFDALKLNVTIITDENGNKIVEYRDLLNQLILKKQQNNTPATPLSDAHSGWLCTYYVHDDFGRLRFVITPKAVDLMNTSGNWTIDPSMVNGLCYKYSYDADSRMVEKKLPDAEPVYMIYDQRSRLIMTQDGIQRAGTTNAEGKKEWSFSVFNDNNDEIISGVALTNTTYTRAAIQQAFDQRAMLNNIAVTVTTNTTETLIANNPPPVFGGTTSAGLSFSSIQIHEILYYGEQNSSLFVADQPGYLANYENTEPLMPSKRTAGLPTSSKVKVFDNSNTYLKTESIYNEKGKVIQCQSKNYLGSAIRITTQYDFQGNTRSTVLKELGTEAKTILTKFEIDHTGRSTAIVREITQIKNGQPVSTGEKRFVENEYDGLGEIASRTYSPGYNGPHGNYLEKLVYEHNIRGWITGINKAYLSGTQASFFGMELGYNLPGNVSFTSTALNGNIAGIAWKSAGDITLRKFDYTYDHANRLVQADFSQLNETSSNNWTNDKFDFSVPEIRYDANGNITRMEQQGVAIAGIVPMDRMTYGYEEKSNKLSWVAEDVSDSDHKLSDFTDKKNQGSNNIDYTYDANGNVISDKNKGIVSIKYNHQNLPREIIFDDGRGKIEYVYDANSVKHQKIVTDNISGTKITTTTYAGPITYAGTDPYYSFEESRVRFAKPAGPSSTPSFAVDYFIKDHLNNVRMVLTEELTSDQYPAATMELTSQATEDQFYSTPNRADKPIELNSVSGATERYGQKMAKLTALAGGQKVGPSILLKTMAGDKIAAKTDYYYKDDGPQTNVNSLIDDIATSLLTHLLAGQGGESAKAQAATISANVNADDVVADLLNSNNSGYVSSRPKAYLNYIIFDEQFKAIRTGLLQVEESGPLKPSLVLPQIDIEKNGFVYIFSNNESEQLVYFDNFQVTHNHGHIREETHYYPFGLPMKAISSKAMNLNPKNHSKYNGKSLESEEFEDGTGLDQYDFGARYYDMQTGRWHVLDPQAEEFLNSSPYAYAANNPILLIDKDGKLAHLIIKYGINVGINIAMQMLTAYMFDPTVKTWGDAWDRVSMWDALWESGKDMIGGKMYKAIGDAVIGMFNYIDDVGMKNVTTAGLSSAGFTSLALGKVMPHIQKYGFKAVKHGLKKFGMASKAIAQKLQPYARKAGGKHGTNTTGFKPLTKENYRSNLAHYTGFDGKGFDAHHVFPQSLETEFQKYGINVHHPSLMTWWSKETHQLFSYEYNEAWLNFFKTPNITTQDVLDYGRTLMSEFGHTTYF